jgi:hypothetical protein
MLLTRRDNGELRVTGRARAIRRSIIDLFMVVSWLSKKLREVRPVRPGVGFFIRRVAGPTTPILLATFARY